MNFWSQFIAVSATVMKDYHILFVKQHTISVKNYSLIHQTLRDTMYVHCLSLPPFDYLQQSGHACTTKYINK